MYVVIHDESLCRILSCMKQALLINCFYGNAERMANKRSVKVVHERELVRARSSRRNWVPCVDMIKNVLKKKNV